jgi:hypothetical protein
MEDIEGEDCSLQVALIVKGGCFLSWKVFDAVRNSEIGVFMVWSFLAWHGIQ